jgi:hypothetical protein
MLQAGDHCAGFERRNRTRKVAPVHEHKRLCAQELRSSYLLF